MPRRKLFGASLNPGPFTIKEHVLITVMGSVGASSAYAVRHHFEYFVALLTCVHFCRRILLPFSGYSTTRPTTFPTSGCWSCQPSWYATAPTSLMHLILCVQIGFSIGGIARRFLVNPPSMIWPVNLVTCALFNTLHSQQYAGIGTRGGLSRERFFSYCLLGSFCWYFVPGYLFTALSAFNWVCWIVPNNVAINQLFGTQSGLSFTVLTFDWSQVAYNGSPLATPWWAGANVAFALVFFYCESPHTLPGAWKLITLPQGSSVPRYTSRTSGIANSCQWCLTMHTTTLGLVTT